MDKIDFDNFEIGPPVSYTRRKFKFENLKFYDDEGIATASSIAQKKCEASCATLLHVIETSAKNIDRDSNEKPEEVVTDLTALNIQQLIERVDKRRSVSYFLRTLMKPLSSNYVSLEASRPWLLYWTVHGLKILGFDLDKRYYSNLNDEELEEKESLADLAILCAQDCWNKESGGWSGNVKHFAHTAPTYAAVLALISIGTDKALDILLNLKEKVYEFLLSVKDKQSGGFRVQIDGEIDTRGLYTALCVADLLDILTPELCENSFNFLVKCQTHEGGFGGEPFNEAHGGYSFCAISAIIILRKNNYITKEDLSRINLPLLKFWIANRQMSFEGGFQGRTNKLVDSCYSFWQGGIPILYEMLKEDSYNPTNISIKWMKALPLAKYIVLCCEDTNGGFRDKPGKNRDQYHSCYALSGLSIAEHYYYSKDQPDKQQLSKVNLVYGVASDKYDKFCKFKAEWNKK